MKIGILGAGQLGRMLALAGIPRGHTFKFYDPAPKGCASDVGEQTVGTWQDQEALEFFLDRFELAAGGTGDVFQGLLELVLRVEAQPFPHFQAAVVGAFNRLNHFQQGNLVHPRGRRGLCPD